MNSMLGTEKESGRIIDICIVGKLNNHEGIAFGKGRLSILKCSVISDLEVIIEATGVRIGPSHDT
jgi:hypothetical protein